MMSDLPVQVGRVLQQPEDVRVFLLLQLLTGLSTDSLLGLRWSDVDLDCAVLTIRGAGTISICEYASRLLRQFQSAPRATDEGLFPRIEANRSLLIGEQLPPLEEWQGVYQGDTRKTLLAAWLIPEDGASPNESELLFAKLCDANQIPLQWVPKASHERRPDFLVFPHRVRVIVEVKEVQRHFGRDFNALVHDDERRRSGQLASRSAPAGDPVRVLIGRAEGQWAALADESSPSLLVTYDSGIVQGHGLIRHIPAAFLDVSAWRPSTNISAVGVLAHWVTMDREERIDLVVVANPNAAISMPIGLIGISPEEYERRREE